MAYQQKGEVRLAQDEVTARVRFEVAIAVRRLLDDVLPEVQAHFNHQLHSGIRASDVSVNHDEVRAKLGEVLLRRLGTEVRRVLPAAKR